MMLAVRPALTTSFIIRIYFLSDIKLMWVRVVVNSQGVRNSA